MRARFLLIGATFALIPTAVSASWLSEVTGVDVKVRSSGSSITINRPKPEAIPEAIEHFPNDMMNFLNPAGTALAVAIRDARANVRPRANKMPQHVKDVLAPYFPASILNRVRWKRQSSAGFGLDSIVLRVADGADAITLDDTVVFKHDPNAKDIDAYELWAHELLHVIQYQNMGVEGFANAYSLDWNGLENQAKQGAAEIRKAIEANSQQRMYRSDDYQNFADIGSSALTQQQFTQAAIRVIPPQNCIQWINLPDNSSRIRNICNTPMRIIQTVKVDPWSGRYYYQPCTQYCFIAPGTQIGYRTDTPGPITNINFDFVR